MSELIPAVIYAAKSSPDEKDSIPDQLKGCRALAKRQGGEVRAEWEFSEEDVTAWKGDRGPQLEAAMALAEEKAPSMLVVQHSDRLARGDARQARHLVEVVLWGIKAGITIRSVQDDLFADERVALLMGAMMGQRNTEDSGRKSKATRDGLRRRKESGKPVGRIPIGYHVEQEKAGDRIVSRRVVDPATLPVVERIFDLVEAGSTFGEVARTLNPEGLLTRGGKRWTARTVRTIVHNRAYVGEKGYPRIIEPERFEAIHAGLNRLDPVQVAKRKGGRKPVDDSFFLRGLLFCKRCGAPLYTRSQYGRHYVCREVRQSTGICDAPVIPAELIESHVLRHLSSFIGSVEGWLVEQVKAARQRTWGT